MLGRVAGVMFVMAALLGGCVASHDGNNRVVAAKRPHVTIPPTTSTSAAPTTTTTSPPQSETRTRVAASASRPRVARSTAAAPAPRSAPNPAPAPAPVWEHYDGQLTGGTYIVAQARGAGLAVSPSPDAAPAATLSNPLPSGAPRVVVVVHASGDWLQVLLPMRPNSSLGWIRVSDVELSSVTYRVEIDRGAHRMHVFDGNSVVMDEPIAVGKPSTPTPTGQFFAVELLNTGNPGGAYGPYAFTLSAYSEVYQTFGSGDGAVGMHGTNEYNSVGQSASHGCVRLHNDAITRLAETLPLGTPVFIR
jgi:hypothetical protein